MSKKELARDQLDFVEDLDRLDECFGTWIFLTLHCTAQRVEL